MARSHVASILAMTCAVLAMALMARSEREERVLNSPAKPTKLTVYFQQIYGGPDANSFAVAGPPNRSLNIPDPGTITVGDYPGRQGISVDSAPIGQGQGFQVISLSDGTKAYASFSLVFTTSKYKGSTMEFQGIYGASGGELSLVSGTNDFRGVGGYGTVEIALQNPAANYTILKLVINLKYHH